MVQLDGPAFSEIDVKKSIFHGHLLPVQTRHQALAQLAQLRLQHPHAVHVCWALLCDGDSGLDDDGEPSGTAAKPIYNVLVHKQCFNVLGVVVRYWGGTKLGAGGLTRAYGQAISEAFKSAKLIEIEARCERRVSLPFSDESQLRRLCEQMGIDILAAHYSHTVELHLHIKVKNLEDFEGRASDLLRGALQLSKK